MKFPKKSKKKYANWSILPHSNLLWCHYIHIYAKILPNYSNECFKRTSNGDRFQSVMVWVFRRIVYLIFESMTHKWTKQIYGLLKFLARLIFFNMKIKTATTIFFIVFYHGELFLTDDTKITILINSDNKNKYPSNLTNWIVNWLFFQVDKQTKAKKRLTHANVGVQTHYTTLSFNEETINNEKHTAR